MTASFSPALPWSATSIHPTGEQWQVLNSPARAKLVQALAGTGKTTTLCMKACSLLKRLGPDARVLMLAYSRAGVTAIRDRMSQLQAGLSPQQLDVLTVEQLSEQVLKDQGDPVHRLNDPLRRRFLILQAQQALRQERQPGADGQYSAWLGREVDIDAFLAFEALAKKRLLDQQFEDSGQGLVGFCEDQDLDPELYRLYRRYERMRVGMNHEPQFYADGDCSFELCRQLSLLDWDQPFEWLQGRYAAVLFDELHDLDEAALLVLRKLVQSDNGVFVGAGDFNQHIHAGAFSVFGESLARIKSCLPEDTEVLQINTTRRFGAEICAALNPLFGLNFGHTADRSDAFVRLPYDSDEHCAQQLVELHRQIVQGWRDVQGQKGQHSALNVVLRNPQDSILLEWVFGHEGVHYSCQDLSPFYLRKELALALVWMWVLLPPEAQAAPLLTPGMVAAAVEGRLHLSRSSARAEAADPDVLAQGQFDEAGWTDLPGARESQSLASSLHGDVERVRRYLAQGSLDPNAAHPSAVWAQMLALPPQVLDDAGALCRHPLLRRLVDEAPITAQERRVAQDSLDSLARLARHIPVAEFLGRLTLIATQSIALHQAREAVSLRLLSINACKGREFTFVAVPFVERGRFPGPSSHQEAYLERNRLYVAMTRARAALWVLESATRPVSPGPV
ncbi:AAA family ATPase [Curvibacter sp. HBC61]|uniref:DNA 3'-5' helicase II n=1 Tax=Curvibacter cyanobacteriorum TaxID=3026422 RepID=A0ABT5N0A6_9BURK|nr:UvrD-helicase domain-containing protein [Curvibacter sp. HBC61]MDD0839522.1 AAA family ATPase [Curvibacter sp. HBC61]